MNDYSKNPRAVYPGTFDPVTLGHLDLVRRATALFDQVIIAVLLNTAKTPIFDAEVRAAMLREALDEAGIEGTRVSIFDGLLVDFARQERARIVLRGLRAFSDFESELQMALMNRRLAPDVETVFLTPGEDVSFISSHLVREVAKLGGDVSSLVPSAALRRIDSTFGGK